MSVFEWTIFIVLGPPTVVLVVYFIGCLWMTAIDILRRLLTYLGGC